MNKWKKELVSFILILVFLLLVTLSLASVSSKLVGIFSAIGFVLTMFLWLRYGYE